MTKVIDLGCGFLHEEDLDESCTYAVKFGGLVTGHLTFSGPLTLNCILDIPITKGRI